MTHDTEANELRRGAARILIVDDRPENLLALEAVLDPLGQIVVAARSGEEALRRALEHDFAVVLMDVQMPGMDGYETAKLLRGRPRSRSTPIIFITAIDREHRNVMKGYEHGAADYIVKPFEPAILQAKVAVFLDLYLKTELIKGQAAQLKDQERQLLVARSEARFQHLIDAMPIAAWAARADGTLYYVNRVARAFGGEREAADRPLSLVDVAHPEDAEAVDRHWQHSVEAETAFEQQCRLQNADGEWRWHIVRGAPEHEDGRVIGWIVTATDIHHQKVNEQAQADLLRRAKDAKAAAEAASRMKDEFLATVSHELRTPLTAILGWSTLLRDRVAAADPDFKKGMAAIERNARAQRQLVEDLLDVSRIITGNLRLERRDVGLTSVVCAAIEAARPAAQAKRITVAMRLDDSIDQIDVDPERLQQVIGNLLSNAVKFTAEGGKIEIVTAVCEDGFEIRVSDDGIGIGADFLPHVFDRFRQADASKTRAAGGLGLGLAIVRHIVELHGGEVEARSEGSGKGSTFVVRMPAETIRAPGAQEVGAPKRPSQLPAVAPVDLGRARILVVDDSEDARELLGELLVLHGADVTLAGSVPEALAAFERARPDLLITDLGMPGEDGFALLSKVRARGEPHVPAIALTGYARSADETEALQAGFDRHLAKPVEPRNLVEEVAGLLRGRRDQVPSLAYSR